MLICAPHPPDSEDAYERLPLWLVHGRAISAADRTDKGGISDHAFGRRVGATDSRRLVGDLFVLRRDRLLGRPAIRSLARGHPRRRTDGVCRHGTHHWNIRRG